MTTKIAHLADTHLGYRQYGLIEREKDFYESFRRIIDDIIDKNVDYVIHSGDLFEQAKPPIEALLVAQQCFEKLFENNIPVYVIAGNHDVVQKSGIVIPQKLYESEKFHILNNDNRIMELEDNIVLCGLPYYPKHVEKYLKGVLHEIYEEVKNYPYKILMLHGSTSKHFQLECEFELDTIPEGFDYYAMGHLHKRIIEKNFKEGILSYPGSTEIKGRDEIADYNINRKGYNLVTIDEELNVEKVDIPLERKFIDREIKYYELDEKLDSLEKEINETILSTTDKKPVVLLTITEGDFKQSEVAEKVYEKLKEVTLNVRLRYQPTEDIPGNNDPDKPRKFDPRSVLQDELAKTFEGETENEITKLGVSLYDMLSSRNLKEAIEISDNFFEKHYTEEKE